MPRTIIDLQKAILERKRKGSIGPVDHLDLQNKAHLDLLIPHIKDLPVLTLFSSLRYFYPDIHLSEVLMLDTEAVYSMLRLLRERIHDQRAVH